MKTARKAHVPLIFTTCDIGRMTGTDPTTVHKWVDKGLLRGYRTPGGHRRVRAEDLRAFMPLPSELGGAQSLRVMLVDAEPESLKSTARALRRLKPGWEVLTCESGIDALLRLSASPPDVLVYDLSVRDADGLAVFRQLRQRSETRALRLLAVAARPAGEVERKAAAAGACACLKKPMTSQELAVAIEAATGAQSEPG